MKILFGPPTMAVETAIPAGTMTAVWVGVVCEVIVGSLWLRLAVIATVPAVPGCVNLSCPLVFGTSAPRLAARDGTRQTSGCG